MNLIQTLHKKEYQQTLSRAWRFHTAAKILLTVCCLGCLWSIGKAQTERLSFDYLGLREGLPSDGAFDLLQDAQGYIWISTLNGLVRYDGYDFRIFRASTEDSLGLTPVGRSFTSLLKAKDGAIWASTLNSGFCRFDPTRERFQNFPNELDEKGNPVFPRHELLVEDSKHRVWMYGINPGQRRTILKNYDPVTDEVNVFKIRLQATQKLMLDGLVAEDSEGNIWVHQAKTGIWRLNETSGVFEKAFECAENEAFTCAAIAHIRIDAKDRMWISTDQGLFVYDIRKQDWDLSIQPLQEVSVDPTSAVYFTYEDQRGNVWVSVDREGLVVYSTDQRSPQFFGLGEGEFQILGGDAKRFVLKPVMEDLDGVWLMNDIKRLAVYDRKFFHYDFSTQRITSYGERFNHPLNKANEVPTSFLVDNSGLMWIGNIGAGVNHQNPVAQRIHRWEYLPDQDLGLATDSIMSVQEDQKGQIWIMGYDRIQKFDPQSLTFSSFVPSNTGSQNQRLKFNRFHEDEEGRFWLGSNQGLYLFEPSSGNFQRVLTSEAKQAGIEPLFLDQEGKLWIKYLWKNLGKDYGKALGKYDIDRKQLIQKYEVNADDPQALPSNQMRDIIQDRKGRIWVTAFGGLSRYDALQDQFISYQHDLKDSTSISSDFISFIFEDSEGRIWIGTFDQGLNLWDEKTDSFLHWKDHNSFSVVLTAAESRDGSLWFGTERGEGLFQMDPQSKELHYFNKEDGIASDVVGKIVQDNFGYLWLPSEAGVTRWNPSTQEATVFDEADGFGAYSNENVPQYAQALRTRNGDIWLNNYTQLFRIQPQRLLKGDQTPPQVLIRSLKIDTQVYDVADGDLLDTHISQTAALKLAYGQNDLTFSFIGLHYARPEENQYSYKLEGIDDDWSEPSYDRKARYAGIPPGNYTFRVKASNADGVWSEADTSLQISIAKAWWQTTAAFIGYFILLALGVWFFIRWYTRKQEEKIKRQEEELELERQLTEQLRALDQLKDQFLANTSHELRTPLNGIIGLSEGVYDRTDRENDREDLELIISSGKRLHHLVDDLLDFSKLKSGEFELERHAVDLSSVIELIFRMSGPAANKKGLSLVNAVPFSLPAVDADPFRLQQILFNLVGNAIKFTEEGEIRVFAEAVGSQVKISVSDTGIGIPQEKLNAIFDAFQQADGSTARKFGGTGLGLTITKQLVSLHGGEIGVNSQVGEGSVFWFTLGASDEEGKVVQVADDELSVLNPSALNGTASAASQPIESPVIMDDELDHGRLRILIVDDEQVNQRVMKSHLDNDRFDLVFVDDGDMALDIMRNSPKFDLVLLDVMMPNMSGYEVCKKIREEYLPSELPVIMVTAKNQVNDLVQGLTRGANDYLAKPFSKQEFLARVKTQIDLNQIFNIADRFIPNEFIRTLGHERLTEVQLGDLVEREVSVIFTDIRSYTTLSEGMSPEDTFRFINGYTHRMGPIIQENRGFVNQYLGDGIMAIFQYRSDDALNAMIEMQVKLREYNVERIAKDRPEIAVGMGLHSGSLIMGIIGDSQRTDAATISDTVNTAARMEGLTKSFGVRILISGSSYKGLKEPEKYHFRYIGKVKVKGKNESVEVYECIDGDPQEEFEVKWELKDTFDEAVSLYYRNHYEESIALTEQILLQ
ncbi:MAG: two-component regulator propeller domain-containing protein, partial [Bacteroidota bacterium]